MTTAPFVELRFSPTELRPRDLPSAGAFLGTPGDALEAALAVARVSMVRQVRTEMRGISEPTRAQLVRMTDLAWQGVFWQFRKVSAPIIADAYLRAYKKADAGEVPMSVIFSLADKHAEKIGDYFHETSRDALAEGFTTLVNRRLPAKAATDQVLDAYGLTPRQMRGYTSAKQFQTPVDSPVPRSIKAKARAYIDRAFTTRTKKLSTQEEHNIDEQAKQFAWMWLQDKKRLSDKAQKMWVTAKDERVCPVCGPLHGKKVGINERFMTKEGAFYTPGLHPNCRCVIRLIENRFAKNLAGTALADFNEEHPRGYAGRFSTKARTKTIDVEEEFSRIVAGQTITDTDTKVDDEFDALIAAQPITRAGFDSPFRSAPVQAPAQAPAPVFTSAPAPVFTSAVDSQVFTSAVDELVFKIAPPAAAFEFAVDLAMDMHTAVRADVEREAKAEPRTKPPVTKLDHPAYALVERYQLHEGEIDRIELTGVQFNTDLYGQAAEASKKITANVDDAVKDALTKRGFIEHQDEKTGKEYHAYLSKQDVEDTVEWLARTATRRVHPDYDPDSIGDGTLQVEWSDEEGRQGFRDSVRYSTIANKLGLDQTDFELYLVRLDETHAEAVEDVSGSANSRERGFETTGWYELVPGSVERTDDVDGHTYSVTTYKIVPSGIHEEPEVEEEPDIDTTPPTRLKTRRVAGGWTIEP